MSSAPHLRGFDDDFRKEAGAVSFLSAAVSGGPRVGRERDPRPLRTSKRKLCPAVDADTESLGAGAVLDRGRRRHPDLWPDVSSAVGALENEMHAARFYGSGMKAL